MHTVTFQEPFSGEVLLVAELTTLARPGKEHSAVGARAELSDEAILDT